MVDETRNVALFRGIHNTVLRRAKHVAAADAQTFIFLFPNVGDLLTDFFADVLNHLNMTATSKAIANAIQNEFLTPAHHADGQTAAVTHQRTFTVFCLARRCWPHQFANTNLRLSVSTIS